MKAFAIITNAILALLVFLPPILFIHFGDNFFSIPKITQFQVIFVAFLIQYIFIMYFIRRFYYAPIQQLEYTVKKFLTGQFKNQKTIYTPNFNPSIDYILKFFSKTLFTLKNIKSEFTHGKEIKWEVELAREIQWKTFSKKLTTIPELDLVASSKPAGEIGWDSYDAILTDDNYYVYVGDATGHGVGAGFIMMMVNSLVHGFAKVFKSGADILGHTNAIVKPRIKANLLMTVLLIRWNIPEKKLYMTGAGHEYLMIYKKAQKKCFKIKSGGAAIGMVKNIDKLLQERQIKFEKDDVAILYSDGITEAINNNVKDGSQEFFWEDRLMKAIEGAPDANGQDYKTARSIYNNISIELSRFMGYQHVQLDDITLAVIHYKWDKFDPANDVPAKIPEEFITEWRW